MASQPTKRSNDQTINPATLSHLTLSTFLYSRRILHFVQHFHSYPSGLSENVVKTATFRWLPARFKQECCRNYIISAPPQLIPLQMLYEIQHSTRFPYWPTPVQGRANPLPRFKSTGTPRPPPRGVHRTPRTRCPGPSRPAGGIPSAARRSYSPGTPWTKPAPPPGGRR